MSEKKTIMRSLGEFFGHVAKGVKSPAEPKKPKKHVLREETTEQEAEGPGGKKVVLRRTITEEVEFGDESPSPPEPNP